MHSKKNVKTDYLPLPFILQKISDEVRSDVLTLTTPYLEYVLQSPDGRPTKDVLEAQRVLESGKTGLKSGKHVISSKSGAIHCIPDATSEVTEYNLADFTNRLFAPKSGNVFVDVFTVLGSASSLVAWSGDAKLAALLAKAGNNDFWQNLADDLKLEEHYSEGSDDYRHQVTKVVTEGNLTWRDIAKIGFFSWMSDRTETNKPNKYALFSDVNNLLAKHFVDAENMLCKLHDTVHGDNSIIQTTTQQQRVLCEKAYVFIQEHFPNQGIRAANLDSYVLTFEVPDTNELPAQVQQKLQEYLTDYFDDFLGAKYIIGVEQVIYPGSCG